MFVLHFDRIHLLHLQISKLNLPSIQKKTATTNFYLFLEFHLNSRWIHWKLNDFHYNDNLYPSQTTVFRSMDILVWLQRNDFEIKTKNKSHSPWEIIIRKLQITTNNCWKRRIEKKEEQVHIDYQHRLITYICLNKRKQWFFLFFYSVSNSQQTRLYNRCSSLYPASFLSLLSTNYKRKLSIV